MEGFKTNEQLLTEAVLKGDRREVRLLIEIGVDPNWRGPDGKAALHHAAERADTGILEDLLAHPRVNVNLPDEDKSTALHHAAHYNRTGAIEKLAARKAVIDAPDEWQSAPLAVAACHGHVESVRLLLKKSADPNARSQKNNTALHGAVAREHLEAAIALVQGGADPTLENEYGASPIDLARKKNQKLATQSRMTQFLSAAAVQKYLKHGSPGDIEAPHRAAFKRKPAP